jgi:hypothetical protein
MINERTHRGGAATSRRSLSDSFKGPVQTLERQPPTESAPQTSFKISQGVEQPQESNANGPTSPQGMLEVERDSGVSDATWHQLQSDKFAAERLEEERQRLIQEKRELKEKAEREESQAKLELQLLQEQARQKAEDDELKRIYEEARIRHEMARRKRASELAELEANAKRAKEEKRKEAEAQKKLRDIGICEAGFRWIKQEGGYRCAGGYHFVSDATLASQR